MKKNDCEVIIEFLETECKEKIVLLEQKIKKEKGLSEVSAKSLVTTLDLFRMELIKLYKEISMK